MLLNIILEHEKGKRFLFNSADMISKISVVTHVVEHNIKNGHLEKNELDKKKVQIFRIYITAVI